MPEVNVRVQVTGPHAPLEVVVDIENKLAYIRVRLGTVARTIEHAPGVLLDVDAEGVLLGFELLLPVDAVGIKDASDKYLGDAEYAAPVSAVSRMLQQV